MYILFIPIEISMRAEQHSIITLISVKFPEPKNSFKAFKQPNGSCQLLGIYNGLIN